MDKQIVWMGQTKKELRAMPEDVKDEVGYALHLAQQGAHVPTATPMKGNLREVMEIRVDEDRDTYRAIYTVKFEGFVYVLDVFKKKSKSGIATPQANLDRILLRLKAVKKHFDATHGKDR